MQSSLSCRSLVCVLFLLAIQLAQTQPSLEPVATGVGAAIGTDFDATSGRLYVAEFAGSISFFNVTTGARQVIGDGYALPEDIKLARDRQHVYVTERTGNLLRVDLSNGSRTAAEVILSGLAAPHQMALSADGNVLFTVEYEAPGRLLRVDLTTRQVTVIATGLQQAVGVLVPSNLSYALVSEQSQGGRISRIPLTPGAALVPQVLTTNLPSVFFLTWTDATQQRFFTPQRDPENRIVAIDLRTPNQPITVVENVPYRPSSVAPGPSGQIYIASDNAITRFGSITIGSVSPSTATASGPAFTLAVTGSGFAAGAVVRWNGVELPTTLVSPTQLTATAAANLTATAGTAAVTVVSRGITSNSVNFLIAPPPAISSLNPSTVTAGGPAFPLTVNGSGFSAGSVVRWNGTAQPTTFGSSTQLTAAIAANLIASAGTVTVTVVSGGVTSNAVNFPVAPRPTISSMSPSTVVAGGLQFPLMVNGSGFAAGSVVQWNGASLPTTVVSSTQVTAAVAANLITNAGTVTVTVVSGGVQSNALNFSIAARPTITSLNPDSRTAGSASFTLTVNGTGFATGAVVQWNGQSLPTTFVGATQLTATVSAERIATPGSAAITVVSQNVTSPAFAFPINNRPQITSLNPDGRAVGSPAFTLTVNGSGFATGAVVQWNGQPLPTTFISTGTLSAAVAAGRIANPGTANITVISQEVTTAPVVFQISALLTIATGPALPPATAGSAYSQRLLATGGTGTFADWVILSGSLPAGLTLDPSTGILSGTPAARSFAAFTVQVSDSSGNKATKLFSIQVLAGGPPSLSIAPESIFLEIAGGAPASEPKINVQVRGAGSLAVRAAPTETSWLSVTPATSTATADTPVSLTIQVNATALAQGTHFGRITVTAGGSTWIVPVTVVVRPAPKPTLQLSQGGLQFKVASGVTTVPAQQFAVINSGQGLLMWTASAEALSGGPSWLSVSPPAGTSDASSRSAPIAEVRVNPAGLAPGNYHGQIRVSAPDATNRSQVLSVALSVLPPEQRVEPVVLPTGLIFIAVIGGPSPSAQEVIVSNVGRNDITFTTEASSSDGRVWFTYEPATSVVRAEGSVRVAARPTAVALQPGIRRGSLVFTFNDGTKRSVELLLVVVSSSSSGGNAMASAAADGECQANQLIPVFTTLSSLAGFSVPVLSSQSVRVRAVEIGPNCAQFVTSGSMWLDVTDGSSTPGRHESEGVWAANWMPVTAGRITVRSTVTNAAGISGRAEVTAQAARDPASVLPVTQSVTNAASYVLGQPVAPGSWIAIKGAELAVVDKDLSNQAPYPTDLSGTTVLMGEQALPLYYVSRQQINALVRFDVPVDTSLPLQVRRQGVPSTVQQVTVAQPQPGIFSTNASGSGQGSIVIAGTTLLAAPMAPGSRPARRGETISIYGAGMGAVDNPPGPDGRAPADPLARVTVPVSVQIGGVPANVTFAGLTPGFVGLYQVNAQVPEGSPSGDKVPVVITQGNAQTPPVTIAVE